MKQSTKMLSTACDIRRHFFDQENDDYRLALALALLAYELRDMKLETKRVYPLLTTLIEDYQRDYEQMAEAFSRVNQRFETKRLQ